MNETRHGRAVRIGPIEIVPIERTDVRVDVVGGVLVAIASKRPVGVLIRTPDGEETVDLGEDDGVS